MLHCLLQSHRSAQKRQSCSIRIRRRGRQSKIHNTYVLKLFFPSRGSTVKVSIVLHDDFRTNALVAIPIVRLQKVIRGWLGRRWLGLRLLYNCPSSKINNPSAWSAWGRKQYLAVTKRLLQWPVAKIVAEKRRIKARLKAYDQSRLRFSGSMAGAPQAKEPMRSLYERYHFLQLILEYQEVVHMDERSFNEYD
jgi:hypothetical protein